MFARKLVEISDISWHLVPNIVVAILDFSDFHVCRKSGCDISKETYASVVAVLSGEEEGCGDQKWGVEHFTNLDNHEHHEIPILCEAKSSIC